MQGTIKQEKLGKRIFRQKYPPNSEFLRSMRHQLESDLGMEKVYISDSKLADLQLILTEAVSNAMRHGCSSHEDRVEIEIYLQSKRQLDIRISDPGQGFERKPGERYKGLALIDALTEEIKHYHLAGRFYCRMIFDLGEVTQ